jgi:hypothetical protein
MKRLITFTAICLLVALAICISHHPQLPTAQAQGFDICLEDDSDKGASIKINSSTADYLFCVGGKSFSGRGSLVKSAGVIVLQHLAADRSLSVRIDTAAKNGTASFESPAGKTLGTIKDGNTADSKCLCK